MDRAAHGAAMTYDEAVRRAVAEMVAAMADPNKSVAGAMEQAVRVAAGDMNATVVPVELAERVRRDVFIAFGDAMADRLRPRLEGQLGPAVADVVDLHITGIIGDVIARRRRP